MYSAGPPPKVPNRPMLIVRVVLYMVAALLGWLGAFVIAAYVPPKPENPQTPKPASLTIPDLYDLLTMDGMCSEIKSISTGMYFSALVGCVLLTLVFAMQAPLICVEKLISLGWYDGVSYCLLAFGAIGMLASMSLLITVIVANESICDGDRSEEYGFGAAVGLLPAAAVIGIVASCLPAKKDNPMYGGANAAPLVPVGAAGGPPPANAPPALEGSNAAPAPAAASPATASPAAPAPVATRMSV